MVLYYLTLIVESISSAMTAMTELSGFYIKRSPLRIVAHPGVTSKLNNWQF